MRCPLFAHLLICFRSLHARADAPLLAVAHVRHPATGQWWQYDDDRVVLLGAHPLGDASAGAGATPGKGKGGDKADKAAADKAAGKGGDKSRGRGAPPPSPPPAAPAAAAAANGADEGRLVSADAYLLLYTRRSAASAAAAAAPGASAEPQLPPDLAAAIAADNASAAAGLHARETASAEVRARVSRRQNEVRAVLGIAEPRPGDDADLRWVSAEWLANWSSTECVAVRAFIELAELDSDANTLFPLQQPSGPD